ncbi:MAG: phosphatidate cytidylyltransferase [Candidatus Saccharimonadales bacterium]
MRKRISTGLVLAVLLFLTISLADAWPLRIGLMLCFGMAMFELWASATYGMVAAQKPQGKYPVFLETGVLMIAALSVVLCPIRPTEMLAIAIAAYVTDIAGYFVGSRLGKTKLKLLEKLSPKKTAEGYIGGLVASWLVTGIFVLVFGGAMSIVPKVGLVLFGGIVGSAGDLLGSAAKRELGIKDADEITRNMPIAKHLERLMAGHGGYLDRFDSLGLVMVFYYFLLLISGAL